MALGLKICYYLRMKTLIFILITALIPRALADNKWFCTEESSQVMSNEVRACGVAYSPTESEGRSIALESAIIEFHTICDISHSCKNRNFDVIPSRTECYPFKNGYKCYRMIRFILR